MRQISKVQHASYSSIDSWMQCGEKYRLTKIEGIKEEPAWWSVGGSAVHLATERYDLGSSDNAQELFIEAFESETKRQAEYTETVPMTWRSSRNQDDVWWRANGPEMVQKYIEWRLATRWHIESLEFMDPDGSVFHQPGVEVPFEVTFNEGEPPLKGYIDRVFVTDAGERVIVDLKTGARRPASDMQLGYYKVGLLKAYDVEADLGGYWMARKPFGEQLSVVQLDRYDEKFVGRYISGFHKARETSLYLPHVTSFCGSCGVASHCWAVN